MKTRSAILLRSGSPLVVDEIDVDPPGRGEVMVRMVAAGVCGSDRHFLRGDAPIRTPVVLGHEGAGVVEAVGRGVERTRVGDRVLQWPIAACRRCRQCRRGRLTHCELGFGLRDGSMIDGSFRLHRQGIPVGAASRLGSFSELSVCPEGSCTIIPDDVDLVMASVLACGVSTGLGAALNAVKTRPGDAVAVIGIGGVGAGALMGAVIGGAATLVAIDIHAEKLDHARELGATHVVDAAATDILEATTEITGGLGLDGVILCIDRVRGENIADAFELLGPGGTLALVGIAPSSDAAIPVPPNALIRGQKQLVGTYLGGMDVPGDVRRYLGLHAAGRLPLDKVVTRTYDLDQINDAFEDMATGRLMRGVVLPAAR